MTNGHVLWVVGKAHLEQQNKLPDGITPYPWTFEGIFQTEEEAVSVCLDYTWFVGPVIIGKMPDELVPWDGAYYPIPLLITLPRKIN